MKYYLKNYRGYVLIEMLVVIFIFSLLVVMVSQSIGVSLKGSRKSGAIGVVHENVDYAMNVMERLLHNAQGLDCVSSCGAASCTGSRLDYTDLYGEVVYFECITDGSDTYVASNSATARLTSDDIVISSCSIFTCNQGASGVPDSVNIDITASAVDAQAEEGAQFSFSSKVLLRNY